MQIARAQTDLGEDVDAELDADKQEKSKHPRKRFIGRKTAAERAERNGGSNGTIEDSGAIQGLLDMFEINLSHLTIYSCSAEKNSPSSEPSPSQDTQRSRD